MTGEAGRAYAAADEAGRRDMANWLLADHIEMAGSGEAGVAAGPVRPARRVSLITVGRLW